MTLRRRVWPLEDSDGNVSLTRPELTPDLDAANTATTYTDNIADASLTTAVPINQSTANSILSYDAATGAVEFAGVNPSNGVGASASYLKTATGNATLLAAAAADRAVIIVVTVDE